MAALGNHRSGVSVHSRMPATVARSASPSSSVSRRRFRSACGGIGGPRDADERLPQAVAQGLESGLRHGLPVEPQEPGLPALLRQAQTLVGRHLAFGAAHAAIAASRTVVLGVAGRDLYDEQRLAVSELVAGDLHVDGRLDRVRAGIRQDAIQYVHLRSRHALHLAVVADATQQHAAAGVGEGGELVGQVVAARADGAIAPELDLLELPAAVLAESKLAPDVVRADRHQSPSLAKRRAASIRPCSTRTMLTPASSRT